MLVYIARRLLQALFVLFAVLLFTFSLQYFQGGGGVDAPCYFILGLHAHFKGALQRCAHEYGFDQPFLVRFWQYVNAVVWHFNLGHSFRQNLSVRDALDLYIPRTFWLAFVSLILTVIIAVPVGVYQAWRRNTVSDYALTGIAFVLYAMPAFLLCILAIQIFGRYTLHLPTEPPTGVNDWAIFTDPKSFILPVACLTALGVAGLSRFMRSAVLDVLVQDYMRTAKAKGASSSRMLFRHAIRNALGPCIVIIGLSIPALLGGALIVEEVFNYVGMGYETVNAATTLDIPVIMGVTVIATLLTVLGNLAADLGLVVINPRIRIEGKAR
jgi:peptide/nickel transport system permease protein